MHYQKIGILVLFVALATSAAEFDPDLFRNVREASTHGDGLTLATSLNLPLSFSHSQSRLGVASGNYVDISGKGSSALTYQKALHQAGILLFCAEGLNTSPSNQGTWDKTVDILRLESRYRYNALPWLSLFAHAKAETSVFKGYVRNDTLKTYEFKNVADQIRRSSQQKELQLTDPFAPIFIQENFGAVAELWAKDFLTAEAKTALSLRQTLAKGQMVLVKEEKDKVVVRDLKNFYQFGYLLGASLNGKVWEDKIAYHGGLDATWPFWQTPKSNKTFVQSLIIEASAGVALTLTSFSSLQYEYTATRLPEVLESFQQYHLLHLNIAFDWLYTFGKPSQTSA